ncbi:fumarylacetoacetase [Nocardioides sp. BGMRC 2183]|nr:fumarylacetoacetase [Nocardioides sp. BGMRC 2183]
MGRGTTVSDRDPGGQARPAGFGVFRTPEDPRVRRVGWRTTGGVIDLGALAAARAPSLASYLGVGRLDPLLAAGRPVWDQVLDAVLTWEDDADRVPLERVDPVLGFTVADYVDFYASEHHAARVSGLFRPGAPPLPEAWKHLPIGYHGRAGSIVVSDTPVVRPRGQRRDPEGEIGVGPTRRLDLEAEVGFVVGVPSPPGHAVPMAALPDHVFGVCLVNDWSARDIQAWEYVPLGPFLGKSFATSVSPWIVPLALLDAARVAPPPRDPRPHSYLDDTGDEQQWGLDLRMEVRLNGQVISRPPAATLYWTAAQQLAHLTVNGAALRAGDLYASGTVSGPDESERGCLLELTDNGARPIELADGTTRGFLEDGDEVVIGATAPAPGGGLLDLGEVRGRVTPSPG